MDVLKVRTIKVYKAVQLMVSVEQRTHARLAGGCFFKSRYEVLVSPFFPTFHFTLQFFSTTTVFSLVHSKSNSLEIKKKLKPL